MKRQRLYYIGLLIALSCFQAQQLLAQRGSGNLPPATKAKPTPTPKGKTSAPKPSTNTAANTNTAVESKPSSLTRRPPSAPALAFNKEVSASLDAQSSGRIATGSYYNEYALTVKASDLLSIQFQPDNPSLVLRIYDPARTELPIVKDSMTGDYRFDTPTGTVPVDGEYRLRVLNTSEDKKAAGAYTLKVVRSGMTEAAYQAQLQKVAGQFNSGDAANVDATITQLDQLIAEDTNKPGAYELLGVIYLNHKGDTAKAESNMEQAIKLGGAGLFKIAYDGQWRRPKRVGQSFEWEDPKQAWLRIHEGKAILADPNNPQQNIFALQAAQIRSIERIAQAPVINVQLLARRTYQFSPASKQAAEADLMMKLLQSYVLRKTR
jgi:hypothetical protein